MVNNLSLVQSLLGKMLDEKSLILLSAILVDLSLQNLVKISEELVVELTGRIAFLAWQSLFVDSLSITPETLWEIILVLHVDVW
jgi:hypothetical protein